MAINRNQNSPHIWQGAPTTAVDGYTPVVQPGFSMATTVDDLKRAIHNFYKSNLHHIGLHADLWDGWHATTFLTYLTTLYQPLCARLTLLCNSGVLELEPSLLATVPNIYADGTPTYGIAVLADAVALVTNGVARLTIDADGKVTIPGLIDPTGLELTPQGANPGGTAANTIWVDSGASRLKIGTNTLAYLSEVGTGDVTAASNITDNAIVRGDGGAKGVQESGLLIGDVALGAVLVQTPNVTGADSTTITLRTGGTTTSGNSGNLTLEVGSAAGTAGAINVGTGNAESVTIGRSGKTATVNGLAYQAGQQRYAINTPSQITGNQTGYTGFNTGYWQRASTDASRTINTILAPTGGAGYEIRVTNVGSFDLVFLNDDGATGTAADRILTGVGGNYTLGPGLTCWLAYDSTSSRWRILA